MLNSGVHSVPGTEVPVSHHQTDKLRNKVAEADGGMSVTKPSKDCSDKHLPQWG